MRVTFVVGLILFLLNGGAPSKAEGSGQAANMESLTRQATFIFVGTVVRTNATTMPEVRASDSTAVVRVDQIIEAPGATPDLAGQEITVQLSAAGSVKPNQRMTFFTRGWLAGNSLAVIEVGRSADAQSPAGVREQVQATRRKAAEEALQREIASAEAVVAGTVASVRPANTPHLGSEHDPNWYQAEITVGSVAKGHIDGHSVTVLFPNSDDVMWQSAPKFQTGEQGVWLLHRNQMALPGIKDRYTVLNALDFQDQGQLERIRSLLKASK